jgi:quercetin dioxygenase-like cupin family protein
VSGEISVIVTPDQRRVLRAFGEEVILLLDGQQTGGRLTMWLETTPPGGGPPLHFHINDDETFHVLEGRVAFFKDSKWKEVGPGGSAFIPRGQLHTFKNAGQENSRMLISTAPAGFDVFFTRCAEEFAQPGGPDMAHVMEIAAEHGIHFVKD